VSSEATPRVTAVVPTWKAAGFVRETLDALAAQTWPNLEILIGDDASPDATPEVLRAFAEGRDDVTLVLRETNLGWVGNCNDLMARAEGELMFFAFHDDLVAPTYVERLARMMVARPEAAMACSDVELVSVEGGRRTLVYDALDGVETAFGRAWRMASREGPWYVPNRSLFRASAFRRIGGMKRHEGGEFAADWPWLLHMSTLGPFLRAPEPLCTKRFMEQSLSRTWKRDAAAWAPVDRAGAAEIRASDLSAPEKAAILGQLALRRALPGDGERFPIRRLRRAARRTLERTGLLTPR
jgi:glycosyltransferase involved in cell wall biosynthesis